jgi:hypothetical protein
MQQWVWCTGVIAPTPAAWIWTAIIYLFKIDHQWRITVGRPCLHAQPCMRAQHCMQGKGISACFTAEVLLLWSADLLKVQLC